VPECCFDRLCRRRRQRPLPLRIRKVQGRGAAQSGRADSEAARGGRQGPARRWIQLGGLLDIVRRAEPIYRNRVELSWEQLSSVASPVCHVYHNLSEVVYLHAPAVRALTPHPRPAGRVFLLCAVALSSPPSPVPRSRRRRCLAPPGARPLN
jgi:hypothetical protein